MKHSDYTTQTIPLAAIRIEGHMGTSKNDVCKSHRIMCCCQFSLEVIVGFFFSGTSLARIGGFSKN